MVMEDKKDYLEITRSESEGIISIMEYFPNSYGSFNGAGGGSFCSDLLSGKSTKLSPDGNFLEHKGMMYKRK